MIWITGDIHGEIDISKINGKNWPEGKTLSKNDYLIIAGDFGLLWFDKPDKTEQWWLKWLNEKPWTTLFIDGNHENHKRLQRLEKIEMFGGMVGKVSDSIYYLTRGGYYYIENKSFFCFGGAKSHDIEYRTKDLNWWPEEVPSELEKQIGLDILRKNGNKVDYLIFHTIPKRYMKELLEEYQYRAEDPTCDYLELIHSTVEFKHGFSGHFHINMKFDKWTILYNKIIKIL